MSYELIGPHRLRITPRISESAQLALCPCCRKAALFRCSVCFRAFCLDHLVNRAKFDRTVGRRRFRLYCCDCDPGPQD